jgi:hypothetical protein
MRINYTTYDLRRAQDSLNPQTHADIMVLSHESEDEPKRHPFWYARILGVFHANIRHMGPRSQNPHVQKMEFLWVRWFGRDLDHRSGWKAKRLHRLGFVSSNDPAAFGFLNPQHVIRAVHLMPAFSYGRTKGLLGPSIVRQPHEGDEDWVYYYIGM